MAIERDSKLEKSIHDYLPMELKSSLKVFCYDSVGSVLDVARENITPLLLRGEKALVLAKSQSQGRGQQGRNWVGVEKAFLGCLLIPQCTVPKSKLPALSLIVAIQIAKILNEYGLSVGVKWPNDILSRPLKRKISGVLLETENCTIDSSLYNLRIGIGVNFSGSPEGATSIQQEIQKEIDLDNFAASLIEECMSAFELFITEGFQPFENYWMELDLLRENPIEFQQAGRTFKGIAKGVDSKGCLTIDVDGELLTFASGQILSS